MNNIQRILPVRITHPKYRICPSCSAWMSRNKTLQIGQANCPECNGEGRIPYVYLSTEQVTGQELIIIQSNPKLVLKPTFGNCKSPGIHRAIKIGIKTRCPGCDDLCFIPSRIEVGKQFSTILP